MNVTLTRRLHEKRRHRPVWNNRTRDADYAVFAWLTIALVSFGFGSWLGGVIVSFAFWAIG